VTCLNHVINLVVDDFKKVIKGYMKKIENCLYIMNNDDDDDDDDDEFDDSISMKMKIERIMSIIFKL